MLPQIFRDIFANSGAGPLLRRDVLPLAGPDENGDQQLGAVKVDGVSIRFNDDGELETDALPVLTLLWEPSSLDKPGFLRANINHGVLARATFPEAAAEVQRRFDAGDSGVVTETAWQAEYAANGMCGKYSIGDGSATFRIPFFGVNRAALAVAGGDFTVGEYRADQMRPITADCTGDHRGGIGGDAGGAAYYQQQPGYYSLAGGTAVNMGIVGFDSSRLGANYSGDITHGPVVGATPYIKMYGVATGVTEANVATLINTCTGKLDSAEYLADKAASLPFRVKAHGRINADGSIAHWEGPLTSVTMVSAGIYRIISDAVALDSTVIALGRVSSGGFWCSEWNTGSYTRQVGMCYVGTMIQTSGNAAGQFNVAII